MNTPVFKKLQTASLSPLMCYILAAILARTATGGSAVAIIILARSFGADGTLAGALAACLTAPHVLGPIYGRWLEKANNAFIVIAISCLLFTVFFQLAILSIDWQQPWMTFIALLFCGACSSFMMGGLSTQVTYLVADDDKMRRKAQSWDALTYGIGLTVGPMLIALLSSVNSTTLAVSTVMYLPVLACLIVLLLPKPKKHSNNHQKPIPGIKQVIKILWRTPALKTTLLMTSGAAFSFAALPIVSVYYSEAFGQGQESGAYLVTLYGVGCLCGAMFLVSKPLVKDALILLKNVGWLLVVCLILVSLSSSFMTSMFAYWLCGVVNSVFFAVTIAARSEYAPVQGAAQIYMWVAAAKISAASLGALAAGILVVHYIKLPIVASILILSVTLLVCFARTQKAVIDSA